MFFLVYDVRILLVLLLLNLKIAGYLYSIGAAVKDRSKLYDPTYEYSLYFFCSFYLMNLHSQKSGEQKC